MPDKYRSFAELVTSEHDDAFNVWVQDRKSPIAIVAPHGGEIEPGTSEIALAIAGTDFSCYLFEGCKTSGNGDLHITSTNFDEPLCLALLQATDTVVTIHGERSSEQAVYLGGLHDAARESLHTTLSTHGFHVRSHWSRKLQGRHERNICNIGRRGAGVQLELSRGLRDTFFESPLPEGRKRPTPRLSQFADAVRQALSFTGTGDTG